MGSDKVLRAGCFCCCCSGFITAIILFAVSFSVLEATEMGLDYSSVSKSIQDDKLYESGRHMLGVGHSFKVFPKDQQSTKFPSTEYGTLEARTFDGLKVKLDLQYQYRLIADLPSVLNMYYDWGRQYDLAYAIAARNILRDVASNWTAYEFFYNRTEIEAKMQSQLEQRIQDNGGTLDDLQLIVIDLPGSFEAELTQTEQVRQNIEQVEFEVKDARVKAANKRKRMFDEALVVGNQMKVEARREYNRKQKELQSLDESLRAQVSAFTALQKRTNLTRQNMLNYVFLQNLHKTDYSADNKLHLQPPSALQCFGDPNDAHCRAFAKQSTYTCTSGQSCYIILEGTNLHNSDVIRLATDTTCKTKLPQAGAETFASMVGAMSTKKVFPVGTITGSVTGVLCYCNSQTVAQGCSAVEVTGLGFAFVSRGALTVS